jgi:hypothetical protein
MLRFLAVLVVVLAALASFESAAWSCQVNQTIEGSELHLEFLEALEVKVGLDNGRPAAKMKVAGGLGSNEYSGSWVNPGELIKISAIRSYSGQGDKKLATLQAFVDDAGRLNWMVVYTGKHYNGFVMTVVASNGETTICEELTTLPEKEFTFKTNKPVIASELRSADDSLVMNRLGL